MKHSWWSTWMHARENYFLQWMVVKKADVNIWQIKRPEVCPLNRTTATHMCPIKFWPPRVRLRPFNKHVPRKIEFRPPFVFWQFILDSVNELAVPVVRELAEDREWSLYWVGLNRRAL